MDKCSDPLPVPYKYPLTDGLKIGNMIRIQGAVPDNSTSFQIKLPCSDTQDADIALDMCVNFHTRQVVCKAMVNGIPAPDVYGKIFPFHHNVPFDIIIITTPESFKIIAGDQIVLQFSYEIQPNYGRLLEVEGQVRLKSVTIL